MINEGEAWVIFILVSIAAGWLIAWAITRKGGK